MRITIASVHTTFIRGDGTIDEFISGTHYIEPVVNHPCFVNYPIQFSEDTGQYVIMKPRFGEEVVEDDGKVIYCPRCGIHFDYHDSEPQKRIVNI